MTTSLPRFVLYRISQRMDRFVHSRSDGSRVIFGFSSREKANQFLQAAGLADDWEPSPMDPQNLQAWLSAGPDADRLALDAEDPSGELVAVEVARAVRAIQSQNPDTPVQVEYQQYPADHAPQSAR